MDFNCEFNAPQFFDFETAEDDNKGQELDKYFGKLACLAVNWSN